MKWLNHPLSGQHFYLKSAVFLTGLAIGLDSSLRQLLIQLVLILAILIFEPKLYLSLLNALKKLLPFFAGYWVFATLFGQEFLTTVFFSVQILYLIAVTVYVLGNVKMEQIASQSRWLRKWKPVNSLFYYLFATVFFTRSFFAEYKKMKLVKENNFSLAQLSDVLANVSALSPQISNSVTNLLTFEGEEKNSNPQANYLGIFFLALLVIVHGL
ncbi:hypothetical protein [Candidatus Cloacimonas acidaminovorans]|jgi:hypothetical protein|uniref:Uncharacterized protein n=1 Tax=Cloacimonas acidaminovorans (strain Evry) TaxID=459349 RepID=B0VGH3_CLOAI|nr:hypothetical protein [Candidatus Cloacimonas acidaminovorans]CAO80410.1 hypothetical protein; putative membrane protein [Candidatus Cloacimonas acidaminovorans str. Evry]